MSFPRPLTRALNRPLARGLSAGIGGAAFSHSFLTSYPSAWTFTRSNTQTFEDHEGLIRTANDGEAAHVGARRVYNYSNDNFGSWTADNSATISAGGEVFFPGSATNEAVHTDAAPVIDQSFKEFRMSCEVRATGSNIGKFIRLAVQGDGPNFGFGVGSTTTIELTGDWQRVASGVGSSATLDWSNGARFRIYQDATPAAVTFEVRNTMLEDVGGQTLQTPSEFVTGQTAEYFGHKHANTVDVDNIIGEAQGAALTGLEGILLEGGATNECTYSRTLDTANNWQMNGTGITQTLNDALSPFGTMTATKIDATTTTGYVQYRILVTVTANTEYTFSWYALLGTATVVDYRVYDNSNAADIIATTPYGSELNTSTYTRVEKTFTTPAGCTQIACYVAAGFESPRFDGTIWCDGVQVEEGNFATSQIDTTSTPLSRTATQLDRNWTLPANNMSYFVEFVVNHDETALVAGGKRIIEFDDGTVNHRALSYFQDGTGVLQGQKRTNGGFASLGTHTTLGYVKGDTITLAFTANETQTAQWQNGTNKKALTSAIATVDWTSIPTQIALGYSASAGVGAANAFISIKTVKVWNEEKTDAFLAGL